MIGSTVMKQAFVCNKCFKTYPVDIKFNIRGLDNDMYRIILRNDTMEKVCETCNCVTTHYLVDAEIADIISMFNKIGYKTAYSCQGHSHMAGYNKHVVGDSYVFIKGNKKLSKKLFKELVKINWCTFSVGHRKTFRAHLDLSKEEDVNLLLNSSTFSVHYNEKDSFNFVGNSEEEAEVFLAKHRQDLLYVLTKYYNDMKKRRKNND